LCHRQLGGLEKCFSAVGRWAKRRRRERAWEKLMDVGEQVSVFIVYAQSSPNSVKMAQKKKKKRKGISDNRYKVFAIAILTLDREKETKLEGTL
jgi:hypothetical protein